MLGAACGKTPSSGICGGVVEHRQCLIESGDRKLALDVEINSPVLQRLERADRSAELHACLHVVHSHVQRRAHDAEHARGGQDRALVQCAREGC